MTVNILVVEKTFPWPETSGSHIRVANIVRALARVGEVDFFLISRDGSVPEGPPAAEPVARFAAAPRPGSAYSGIRRLAWLAMRGTPVEVAMRDFTTLRSEVRRWARPHYDLVWIGRAEGYVALQGLIDAPHVVDFDDLKDQRIAGSLRVHGRGSGVSSGPAEQREPAVGLRLWGTRLRDTANARRWRALEQRIAASVEGVVVCSTLDQSRLGVPNAVVIPNGYPAPPRPVGRIEVREPPTLVLPGLLRYGPNIDAAHYFVREVLPRIRARSPAVRARLVGDRDDRVSDLAEVEGVTLTGLVPDIVPELELADAVVVPLRFGSGTRVKILEAFAHRIPVVSTVFGCEGLDAVHRRHLLVADDAEAFASACIEVLTDRALRSSLTAEAHALYWQRYRWDVVAPSVAEFALGVARGATGSPPACRRLEHHSRRERAEECASGG